MLLNRALKNGFFNTATQVVSLVLGLAFAGMTIRYLGTARAGFFVVAGLVLGWFGVAGMGGFRAAAVHRLAALSAVGDLATSRAVLGTVLSANLLVAAPFAVASVVAFPYLFVWSRLEPCYRSDAWYVIAFGAAAFMVDQWSATLRGLYSAHQRFDLVTATSFAFGLAGNLARLFVLVRFKNMTTLGGVNLIVSVLWLGADMALTRRLLHGWVKPVWHRSELRPLMRFGLWAWAGDIIGAIANNFGNMATTYFLGSAPLPFIAIPQRIVHQVHTFVASACYFLFPTLAAEGESAAAAIAKVEDRLRWFVATSTWAMYSILIVGGEKLLALMGGTDFARHAYRPLVLFCVLMAVNALNIVYSYAGMAVARLHPSVVAENSATLLTAVTSVLLIPRLGYLGACCAALWKIPAVLLQCIWTRRELKLPRTAWAEWAPYFSPGAGIAAWAIVAIVCRLAWRANSEYVALAMSLVIGGLAYVAIVGLLEKRFFPSANRWRTVERAADVVLRRVNVMRKAA